MSADWTCECGQTRYTKDGGPVAEMCDFGHAFAKLPNHPLMDGAARCPYCMAKSLDDLRAGFMSGDFVVKSELVEWLEGKLVFEEKQWMHMAGRYEFIKEVLDHLNSKKR